MSQDEEQQQQQVDSIEESFSWLIKSQLKSIGLIKN